MTLMREDGFHLENRKAGNVEGEGKELPDKALTADVISAAIAVHRALGPGFLEAIYEEAFCVELAERTSPFPVFLISRFIRINEKSPALP